MDVASGFPTKSFQDQSIDEQENEEVVTMKNDIEEIETGKKIINGENLAMIHGINVNDETVDMANEIISNIVDEVDVKDGNNSTDVAESFNEITPEYYTVPDDISKTIDEGPTQPRLDAYPKTPVGASRTRSFCANWFNRFPWLEYSLSYDKVYCFACRHFNNSLDKPNYNDPPGTKYPLRKSATIYATTGFARWAKAHERMKRHNSSARHIEAMKPWLQDTLDREKNEAALEDKTPSQVTNDCLEVSLPSIKSEEAQPDSPLPSKRKRSRPTKKSSLLQTAAPAKRSPLWCSCSECDDMPKVSECVCCCDIPEVRAKMQLQNLDLLCITKHPGFKPVCLNHWVLQVAYYQNQQEHGPPEVSEDFERYRYIAYCQFVRWCWGVLKEDMHVPLPSCVVNLIKMNFHSNESHLYPSLDDLPIENDPL